jgi:hypothetical protein
MRKIVDEISVVANGQEAGAQRADSALQSGAGPGKEWNIHKSLFSVMRMFAASSGGAPKLEVPVVKTPNNALAGTESILMYGGVRMANLTCLIRLSNGRRED